jgi:molybdenum cofactor cytidylyltransferase
VSVAALVLAAGDGSRFGSATGGKLGAMLDGRVVLQHVLDTVAAFPLFPTVVVLGRDATALAGVIDWRAEQRVVNPAPELGVASSVRVGFEVLAVHAPASTTGALVLLGDQPRVAPAVIRALLAAPVTEERPIAVPRYADGRSGRTRAHPPSWWHVVEETQGDRGLGPVISSRPDRVIEVPVAGSNPDVDTRADLDRLRAEAAVSPRRRVSVIRPNGGRGSV